jgi:DNA-binding NtrC family response regulator
LGRPKSKRDVSHSIEDWELDLVKKVTYAFQTTERDELEEELISTLHALKSSPSDRILDWRKYMAKALYNRAENLTRSWRRSKKREAVWEARRERPQNRMDDEVAFALAWAELGPELRYFWEVLAEEGGNQARTARRLGIHRNTARLWRHKIREIFQRHGF